MSFTEPGRHRLHQALEEALGPDEANTLMAHLPPFAWTDIATKADLNVLRDELARHFDASITELRGEMHMKFAAVDEKFTQRFSGVDSKLAAIDSRFAMIDTRFATIDTRFATTDSKISELRSEMHVGFAELRSEMHKNSFIVVGGIGSLMALLATITNLFG